jgi:uncharacterized protein
LNRRSLLGVLLLRPVIGRAGSCPAVWTAGQQLDDSLRRLQTDRIDLIQFHEIIRNSDSERIFAPGGAIEAVLKARQAGARQAGKVRYIGFPGHKSPDIHMEMLKTAFAHGVTFDAVQMPLYVMDAHFDSFEARVLPVLGALPSSIERAFKA